MSDIRIVGLTRSTGVEAFGCPSYQPSNFVTAFPYSLRLPRGGCGVNKIPSIYAGPAHFPGESYLIYEWLFDI
jgi:hypothetical protein